MTNRPLAWMRIVLAFVSAAFVAFATALLGVAPANASTGNTDRPCVRNVGNAAVGDVTFDCATRSLSWSDSVTLPDEIVKFNYFLIPDTGRQVLLGSHEVSEGELGVGPKSVTIKLVKGATIPEGAKCQVDAVTAEGYLFGNKGDCLPPAPSADHQKRDVESKPDCENLTVTISHQTRDRSYVWNGRKYVPGPWSEWTTVSTSTRDATLEECAPPEKPEPVVVPHHTESVSCETDKVTLTDWTTTFGFHLEGRTWVQDAEGVDSAHVVTYRDATLEECPAPEKPKPVVVEASSTSLDCTTSVVVTHHTRTTTDWVLQGRTWVKTTPVTINLADETRPATAKECPVVITTQPKPPVKAGLVSGTPVAAPALAELPHTGGEMDGPLSLAIAALSLGLGLVLLKRRMITA